MGRRCSAHALLTNGPERPRPDRHDPAATERNHRPRRYASLRGGHAVIDGPGLNPPAPRGVEVRLLLRAPLLKTRLGTKVTGISPSAHSIASASRSRPAQLPAVVALVDGAESCLRARNS